MLFAVLLALIVAGIIIWMVRNRNSDAPHHRSLFASIWEMIEAFVRGR